jgi:hypothetical protein
MPPTDDDYLTERLRQTRDVASFGAGAGAALTLVCSDRGDLSEIRIALKPSALEGDLDGGDLHRDGPAPATRCPGTVRIEAAGP